MENYVNYWEKLFHTCVIVWSASFLIAFSGVANAEETTGEITDHYKQIISQKPYVVEVCKDVATSGDKTGDTVMGAIIGGVIGNNVTKDLPDGGTAGAIIGGLLGNMNSDAKGGTKTVCERQTRYNETTQTVYSYSTITFTLPGSMKEYTVRFKK